MPVPFHFAFHVLDLDEAREFYSGALGAIEGRSTETWVDFDFFGHQLSLHLGQPFANEPTGKVQVYQRLFMVFLQPLQLLHL